MYRLEAGPNVSLIHLCHFPLCGPAPVEEQIALTFDPRD